jgi:hypothetical protein
VGQKWAQTMRTDKLYDRFPSVFLFKVTLFIMRETGLGPENRLQIDPSRGQPIPWSVKLG